MDFFGHKAKEENDAYKKAIENNDMVKHNYRTIMYAKNMERLAAAILAAAIFSKVFHCC